MASSTAITERQHASGLDLPRREKMEILFAILLALFLGALDQTVVGTALPQVVTDLGGNDYYTWVVTIYLLTSTITVPFYGKLSDLLGRKPILLFGISVFLIGSALSGLSQTMWQLILFRGIQGIGAGSLFPIALAVIGDLFTPAERGRYQGLFGAVFGLSFLVGPALGGFLTDTISWHWVFYVNLPIGLVSLYVVWHLLPNIRHPNVSRSIDYLGAAVFTVAISLFLIGLTNKQTGDWLDPQVGGLIAAGLAIGLVFVAIEARAAEPIVPLDLFRNGVYATSIAATTLVSFGFFGAIIFIPRWFQVVRGFGATESGYQMFPLLIGLIASSIVSGQVIARTGKYKAMVVASIAIMTLGIWLMTRLTADTELPVFYAWMFVTGVGIGPTLAAFTIIVQNAVPFEKLGVATSNLTFFRQIGGSVGLAIAGTVFGQSLRDILPGKVAPVLEDLVAAVPAPFRDQVAQLPAGGGDLDLAQVSGVGQSFGQAVATAAKAGAPADAQPFIDGLFAPFIGALDHAFFEAFSAAIGRTFDIAVVTTGAAVVAVLLMRELPLRKSFGPRTSAAPGDATDGSGEPAHDGPIEAPIPAL
ncbi:MAG TPA: MDR family MFS transporter [Candidatus Sulfomarinibacteraceae bacterium]|nr:MDR family MFS transporter [Candidatus Sulfomarinibacteraceae bacterium]